MDQKIALLAFICLLTAISSFLVLIEKKLIKATFYLILSLVFIAVIYIILDADFIASSQLVIYVGGILILILIGMNTIKTSKNLNFSLHNFKILIITITIVFVAFLFYESLSFISIPNFKANSIPIKHPTLEIGKNLTSNLLLVFEIITLVLTLSLFSAFCILLPKSKTFHKN